jgi:hypothetical protein
MKRPLRPSARLGLGVGCSFIVGCSVLVPLDELERGTEASASTSSGTTASSSGGGTGGDGSTTSQGGSGGAGGVADLAAIYAAEVLADEPIAYYRLDERVTPTFFDSGPNGYDGIYAGSVELSVPGILPGNTGARMLEQNARIDVPGAPLNFAGKLPFSVELWFRPDATQTGNGALATFNIRNTDNLYRGWLLVMDGPEGIRFRREPAGGHVTAAGVVLAEYNHAVATFDGVTARIYLNGVAGSTSTPTGDVEVVDSQLTIGRGNVWAVLEGDFDEVALYDKALPPSRITAHYEAGKAAVAR